MHPITQPKIIFLDILQDALPEIENVDTVIYCPVL
jgi:hypothetical protein